MIQDTDDLRIAALRPLLPPAILMEELPVTCRTMFPSSAAELSPF